MAVFLKLKHAARQTDCLINVDHIQQVRSLGHDKVRILWGTAIPEEGGARPDTDDYQMSFDIFIGKLRILQVEVLP